MTEAPNSRLHPSGSTPSSKTSLRLQGRRLMLRPLAANDFTAWSEVRLRNGPWLTKWEPLASPDHPDPSTDRNAFNKRCDVRNQSLAWGHAYPLGIFINDTFIGEVNINNVVRSAMQCGTIGYWLDEAYAGKSYMSEAVLILCRYAFEQATLHRLEICIVPRNHSSRRVVEKLGIREEGFAERFLEINGVWEDHVRYGFTIEEWQQRKIELTKTWL